MRTPRAVGGAGQDHIMAEAQNLARLQTGQTPLLGGTGPDLAGSDFGGVTPRAAVAATPHPLAAAGLTPAGGATPALPGMAALSLTGSLTLSRNMLCSAYVLKAHALLLLLLSALVGCYGVK